MQGQAEIIKNTFNNRTDLKTQLQILKSPSLLMPVFNFVKDEKIKLNPKNRSMKYTSWINSLDINLQKKTSVVNISYKDTDKNLILPVINLLSSNFQNYSTKEQRNNIDKSITYLNQQIKLAKDRTFSANQELALFSKKYGIRLEEITSEKKEDNMISGQYYKSNLEKQQIEALNNIKAIEFTLSQVKNQEINVANVAEFEEVAEELLDELKAINIRLVNLRINFRENDDVVLRAITKKNLIKSSLKNRLITHLQNRLEANQNILEESNRPQEVLSKFDELVRKAFREEQAINQLESQRLIALLEKARSQNPWELITKPTLIDEIVSPKKSKIILLGLIFGLLLGTLLSIILENKNKIIYDIETFKIALNKKLICIFDNSKKEEWNNLIRLIFLGQFGNNLNNKSIALIPITDDYPDFINEFKNIFSEIKDKQDIKLTTDLIEASSFDIQIILTYPNFCSKEEFNKLKVKLDLQGNATFGWIYFSV